MCLLRRDAFSAGRVVAAASFDRLQTVGAGMAQDARGIVVGSIHIVRSAQLC